MYKLITDHPGYAFWIVVCVLILIERCANYIFVKRKLCDDCGNEDENCEENVDEKSNFKYFLDFLDRNSNNIFWMFLVFMCWQCGK